MARPRADRYRDIRAQIDLIGHTNVPTLRRGVYVAVSPPDDLTLAQATLLGLLVAGYSELEIAAILNIGLSTMKSRFQRLRDLMGAGDNAHLGVLALESRAVIIRED